MNEPLLIVRPDDGPIGPKHVALYVITMVIRVVLDENINTLFNPQATNVIYIYIYIYIYGAPILDVSRSHTTTQHSR